MRTLPVMIRKLLSFLSAITLFAFAQAQETQSNWVSSPAVLDGSPAEWPQPFRYYDGVTRLQFALANDTANLYICLLVNDEGAQHRIFRGGLNLWLDSKGKKKETFGLTFPVKRNHPKTETQPDPENATPEQPMWGQNKGINKLKERELAQQNILVPHGMADIEAETLPLKNKYGVEAALGWDSLGILCIEYQIPIKRILNRSLTAGDTLLALQLGLIEPAIEGINKKDNKHDENNDRYSNMTMPNSGMGSYNNSLGSQGLYNNAGYDNSTFGNSGYGAGYNSNSYAAMAPPTTGTTNSLSQDAKCWSKLKLAYRK